MAALFLRSLCSSNVMRNLLFSCVLATLPGCASVGVPATGQSHLTLYDASRQRSVPVELYFPANAKRCSTAHPCATALLSPGYGLSPSDYSFIATALTRRGYSVFAIQHQLPTDPPIPIGADLFKLRSPSWEQGAENLRFVHEKLRQTYPRFDWQHVTLVGHSNGGDIAAWLLRQPTPWVSALVTLDNRRVPLPQDSPVRVLSIRGSDYSADPAVLPPRNHPRGSDICIVRLDDARHNDMHDGGPAELKREIARLIEAFSQRGSCPSDQSRQSL